MQIFDVMVATAGEIRMDLQRFSELFALAVQTSDLADRPQTLDCVMVGSPDRMRVDSPKALVILGVNDGVFPFVPSNGTLLRDEERMALSKLGLELQGDFKEKVLEERFIAYKALSAPMNDLLLTSRRADIAGEIRQPSELLNQLFRIYPKLLSTQYEDVSPLFFCRSEETSFSVLARQYSQKNDASKTLSFYFRQKSQFESRLALLEHAMQPRKFEIQNSEIAKKLFGNKIYLSPSRVEAYYRCPFSYFCRYGLNVLPRNRAEFNPMERGNVTHDILYRFVSEYGETMLKLTENEVKENVGRYLKRYMEEVMGGDAEKSKRFLASFYRLQKTVSEIILRLIAEFRQSAFKPVDFELEIGKDENLSPLRLQTADGSEILVSGTIDRVDLCEINGKKFVRVVDYKSGTKKFKLSDVYYGLNLQMILYLFILWRNGKKKYENVFPAGVLYMPAGETVPALPRSASGEETEKQKLAQYKMSGFVLEDPDVVNAMEQGGKGIFIPVELKKDGSFGKRSSLLKLEELGKMERYIDSLILKMAEELHAGEIGASPAYSSGGRPPCDYCDYGSVCGHKNTASKNPPVKDLDKGKFFEEIGGGQNAGQKLD